MRGTIRLVLMAAVASGFAISEPAWAAEDPMTADDGSVLATPMRPAASKAEAEAREADVGDAVEDYLKDVHGEVTAMVDSRGGYNVSGTAVLPLGENGTAVISMSKGSGPSAWRDAAGYAGGPYPWYWFR